MCAHEDTRAAKIGSACFLCIYTIYAARATPELAALSANESHLILLPHNTQLPVQSMCGLSAGRGLEACPAILLCEAARLALA